MPLIISLIYRERKNEIALVKLVLRLGTELNRYEELPLGYSRTLDDSVAVAMFEDGQKE